MSQPSTESLRDCIKRWRDWLRNSAEYRYIHHQNVEGCADELEALLLSLESVSQSDEYDRKSVDVIKNLSTLVRRLCYRHPNRKMVDQALGYLRGEHLEGNILREAEAEALESTLGERPDARVQGAPVTLDANRPKTKVSTWGLSEGLTVLPDDEQVSKRRTDANRPCPEPLTSESEFGNLKTAQDVAYRIFAEITVIPADAQAAKVIALISRAVAQARVDVITQCAIEAGERSPEGVSSHTMLGDMWDRRIAKERDLAAIAKEPVK